MDHMRVSGIEPSSVKLQQINKTIPKKGETKIKCLSGVMSLYRRI